MMESAKKYLHNLLPGEPMAALFALLSVSLVVLWGYGDTCQYQFVFDDFPGIINNESVRNLQRGGISGFRDLFAFSGERIFTFLTFAWSWSFSGPDPCAFRLFNLCLHVMTSTLVGISALAIFELGGGKPTRMQSYICILFSACFFAAHPLQTQAVTYIYQRLTGLCAFFCVLSFYSFLRWLATGLRGFRFFSMLALFLGVISKPNAAMIPIMMIVLVWAIRRQKIRESLQFLLPVAVIPLLMKLSQGTISGRISAHGASDLSWWQYFFTQGRVIWKYVWLIFWPQFQSVDHVIELSVTPFSQNAFAGIVGWVLVGVLFWIAIRACVNPKSSPFIRLAAFGGIWFFAMLMIESSVIPIRDLMMEHRVYLPFAGVSWAVSAIVTEASGTVWFRERRRILIGGMVLVTVGLASLTELRNRVWENPETLWRSVLVTNPESSRAQLNLGNALLRDGRFEEALGFYETLGRSGTLRADSLYHRALALVLLRRFDEAEKATGQLLEDFPAEVSRTAYLRAQEALVRGDFAGAYRLFANLDKSVGTAGPFQRHVRMGMVRASAKLALLGDLKNEDRESWRDRAMVILQRILAADPLDGEARVRLARILAGSERRTEALKVLSDAPSLIEDVGASWLALVRAEILEDPAKPDAALQEYRMAISRYPGHEGLLIWVGAFLATLGDNDRIHQIIGGTREIDVLAGYSLRQAAKLQGSFQMDESVLILRKALLLCEAGAHKCSLRGELLQRLGAVLVLFDPDSQAEAEGLINRAKALRPEVRDSAPPL